MFGAEAGGSRPTAGPPSDEPAPDLIITLRAIVRSAAEQVSGHYAVLAADIPGDGGMYLVTCGLPEEADPHEWCALEGTGDILDSTEVFRVDDLAQLRARHGLPPLASALTTLIGAPIRLDEQLYGYLYVANKRCSGTFTSEDEEPVLAMATAAAAAIENARLLNLEHRRQQWLEASLEMTRVLLSDDERSRASRVAVRLLQDVTAADFAALVLVVDNTSTSEGAIAIDAVSGIDAGRLLGASERLQGLSARVAATGERVISPNITEEPGFDPPAGAVKAMSMLGPAMYLPLTAAGEVLGLLIIGWLRGASSDHVAPTEVGLAEMIAGQVALALHQLQAREMVTDDRDRIAHDLDETTVGRLVAVDAHLADTVKMISEPGARDRVNAAIDGLHEANQQLRAAITTLQRRRPPDEDRGEGAP
ncbi:GAF domain-containing protein [Actinopolymorpha pittospori]|uniref:GAF domain-containing protein n=1 Tax=Actinopolymorpha pittospori TaxID=648752 RepID=A0A927R6N3_9ACTN|nr:GAF domain-containing protein [Actinopolymorpha pittospori]MBE1604622.1 GAF domain-containing protein [Actinopolymorpha pittospori]